MRPASPLPQDGDVIVRVEERGGTVVYALCIAPGQDPHFLRTREEAIAQGLLVAERQRVCVWLANEGDVSVVEDFRGMESV